MESNQGNLCCHCVSGQHLEKCLPLLALLMVYDKLSVWENEPSVFFPVTYFVTQHTFSSLQHRHLKTQQPHTSPPCDALKPSL